MFGQDPYVEPRSIFFELSGFAFEYMSRSLGGTPVVIGWLVQACSPPFSNIGNPSHNFPVILCRCPIDMILLKWPPGGKTHT